MYTRFVLSIFAIFLFNCQIDEGAPEESGSLRAFNLAMGNPTNATADVKDENNYLMESTQYSLSYNRSRAIPNWVSWYLGSAWLGAVDRQDDFRADTRLPTGWYRVLPTNYSASGFDRGHNCPSGDRTKTAADNSSTFLMTNMIPQAPGNNQGPWSQLEQYCRKLVEQGNELYIIMGNYGSGGTGSAGFKEKIATGKITVPRSVWKVILVLPKGSDDLNRVNKDTRVIAVDIPNRHDVSGLHWGDFRVPVDDIESAAKVNVLSALPENIQAAIESRTDKGPIN
jgi:endonuclease G